MIILGISVSNIVLWAIAGIIAGYAVHAHDTKKRVSGGIVVTPLFGCLGAVAGGYMASFLLGKAMPGFSLEGLSLAVAGAMLLAIFFRFSFRNDDYVHPNAPHKSTSI